MHYLGLQGESITLAITLRSLPEALLDAGFGGDQQEPMLCINFWIADLVTPARRLHARPCALWGCVGVGRGFDGAR